MEILAPLAWIVIGFMIIAPVINWFSDWIWRDKSKKD